MKLLAAFIRLIRSVNLLFIAITQLLFQYCIVWPVFHRVNSPLVLTTPVFSTLVVASVLIAAAGYIINDYFDLNIDLVNNLTNWSWKRSSNADGPSCGIWCCRGWALFAVYMLPGKQGPGG